MAYNLIDYAGRDFLYHPIKEDFKIFLEKTIESNFNLYDGKYIEDFKLLISDLNKKFDLRTLIALNPLFHLNFHPLMKKLQKDMIEKAQEINFKKINLALDLIELGGYDINKIKNFNFSNFCYMPLDIVFLYLI
jgi:hypothetical protein